MPLPANFPAARGEQGRWGATCARLGRLYTWDCGEQFPVWTVSWRKAGLWSGGWTLMVPVSFCPAEPWHGGGWERDPGPEHEQAAAARRLLPHPDAPGAHVPPAAGGDEQPVFPAERGRLLGLARGLHQNEAPEDRWGWAQRDDCMSFSLTAPPHPVHSACEVGTTEGKCPWHTP